MRGVSREIAHLHCRSPLTSKAGIWFDGFERENNKRQQQGSKLETERGITMSAFVVKDKTINRVVTFLSMGRDLDWIRRLLASNGYDLETDTGKKKLADDMFSLNVKGVDARYGEGEANHFRPLNFAYRLEPHFSTITAYKSLGCWLYQCQEGDIAEESALYKLMSQVKGLIAEHIVSGLAEYDKAP